MKPAKNWTTAAALALEEHIKAYALKEGLWHGTNRKNTDWPTAMSDVMADFMHLADKHKVDFQEILRRGENHHSAERCIGVRIVG